MRFDVSMRHVRKRYVVAIASTLVDGIPITCRIRNKAYVVDVNDAQHLLYVQCRMYLTAYL